MRPDELIAGYVADVAEQLPIRMRNDVAMKVYREVGRVRSPDLSAPRVGA